MQFGEFKIHVIRESLFKLDGGAMYGIVPKPVWNKVAPSDELNRIELACNLLLIESPHGRVLVDTGMGSRWDEKSRERFSVRSLVDHRRVLDSIGLSNADVNAVVATHMHFDHFGGAVSEVDGKLVPTFPNAMVYVQESELLAAQSPNPRSAGSYRVADYKALEDAGLLKAINGDHEVLPGITIVSTGGHTKGHQIVRFESEGRVGFFLGDLLPTISHCEPAWTMGYDCYPLETSDVKARIIAEAIRENALMVLDHETGVPWGSVSRNDKGKIVFSPLAESSLAPHAVAAN